MILAMLFRIIVVMIRLVLGALVVVVWAMIRFAVVRADLKMILRHVDRHKKYCRRSQEADGRSQTGSR